MAAPALEGTAMAYCCRCGVYAALDDDKTCTTCRLGWRPAGPVPADLGCHAQPQPLAGSWPANST